jgi:ubiquitin-protein ligase
MIEISSDQLTLTPAEIQNNRWSHELQRLKTFFPKIKLLASAGSIVAAEGPLDTQYKNTYPIRIELTNYPFSLPKVRPLGWSIHSSSPHQFNDGTICLMRSDQWRRQFTVALVVAKAAIWLGKYEIWQRNGHFWPGLGQRH